MSLDPLTAALDIGKMAIKRIWPDANKRAEEIRKLEEIHQKGDLAQLQAKVSLLQGQMAINVEEAKHASIFVAGWRPFIGWVCGSALVYNFILYPLLLWAWALSGTEQIPPPSVDGSALYPVLMGMLGIGAMRSYDKRNKTDTKGIR